MAGGLALPQRLALSLCPGSFHPPPSLQKAQPNKQPQAPCGSCCSCRVFGSGGSSSYRARSPAVSWQACDRYHPAPCGRQSMPGSWQQWRWEVPPLLRPTSSTISLYRFSRQRGQKYRVQVVHFAFTSTVFCRHCRTRGKGGGVSACNDAGIRSPTGRCSPRPRPHAARWNVTLPCHARAAQHWPCPGTQRSDLVAGGAVFTVIDPAALVPHARIGSPLLGCLLALHCMHGRVCTAHGSGERQGVAVCMAVRGLAVRVPVWGLAVHERGGEGPGRTAYVWSWSFLGLGSRSRFFHSSQRLMCKCVGMRRVGAAQHAEPRPPVCGG